MRRCLRALALCLAAETAQAVSGTTVDSVVFYPTYHNIGVRAYYSGDDDTNATIIGLVKRTGAAAFDTLPPFVREAFPGEKRLWVTSALWCGSDSNYTFHIALTDAGGCTGCAPTDAAVQTWAPPDLAVTGKQIWMGPFGSDANSGLDSAHPKRTFASALAAMTTSGDQIRLLSGDYSVMSTDTLFVGTDAKNGSIEARYSVVGEPGARLFADDTTMRVGANWTRKTIYSGVTAHVRTGLANTHYPRVIVVDDSTRLYPYQTFFKFATDTFQVMSATRGCFWVNAAGDSVLVRLPTGMASPTGHTFHVPCRNTPIFIKSAFWRVDSLEFRYFGTGRDAGLSWPVVTIANVNNLVENCTFVDNARPATGVRTIFDACEYRTNVNTFQKNTIIGHTIGQAYKGNQGDFVGFARDYGYLGCRNPVDTACTPANIIHPQFLLESGRGHVIRWNKILGASDGGIRWTNTFIDTSQKALTDIDVYGNQFTNIAGEAFEPDACAGLNVRIYRNLILGSNAALHHEILRGPFYFFYNTAIQHGGAVAVNGADGLDLNRGYQFIVNNTFHTNNSRAGPSNDASKRAWRQPSGGTQNVYINVTFVNNIVDAWGAGDGWIYEAGARNKNAFNYNAVRVLSGSVFASHNYTGYTRDADLPAWRTATGYGANDLVWTGAYRDTTHDDVSPIAGAVVLGTGRSFPGINTNNGNHGTNYAPGLDGGVYIGAWPVGGMQAAGIFRPLRP